jgi:two-component system, response regulator
MRKRPLPRPGGKHHALSLASGAFAVVQRQTCSPFLPMLSHAISRFGSLVHFLDARRPRAILEGRRRVSPKGTRELGGEAVTRSSSNELDQLLLSSKTTTVGTADANKDDDGRFILLVEDNPDDELLTRRALRRGNIVLNLVVIRDGREAVDFLLGSATRPRHPIAPTLTLMDVNLPNLGGFDILRLIRQDIATRSLPVVFVTSSTQDEENLKRISSAIGGYTPNIRKPVGPNELLRVAMALSVDLEDRSADR